MTALTIADAAGALRAGTLTATGLLRQVSDQADKLDPQLGVYLTRFTDEAAAAAEQADRELTAGIDRGPLHGIPLGIKDILATKGWITTAQSLVHEPDWWQDRDAPVVARLRAAGAVITGKTTTMEYAIGLPDPDKPFPVPRNPWDPATWTGGSSWEPVPEWRPGCSSAGSAPTPAAASASRRPIAGSPASSRPTVSCPGRGACRSGSASTTSGRWRAAPVTAR